MSINESFTPRRETQQCFRHSISCLQSGLNTMISSSSWILPILTHNSCLCSIRSFFSEKFRKSSFLYPSPNPNSLGNVPTYTAKQRKAAHPKNFRLSRTETSPSYFPTFFTHPKLIKCYPSFSCVKLEIIFPKKAKSEMLLRMLVLQEIPNLWITKLSLSSEE